MRMRKLERMGRDVIQGKQITRSEAVWLSQQPLEALCSKADEIRARVCSNQFDICTIINGKSGHCSEDCRFCAQSVHYHTGAKEYALRSEHEIVAQAKQNDAKGVLRYSIVTSGKRLPDGEVDHMCQVIRRIRKETNLSVCVSFGLLEEAQYQKLKEAGVTRIHHNLETSRRNFPNLCTTHTFEDKVRAIQAAQAVGLSVCSGGIMGLGETWLDRIDLALTLRELGIQSVPVNLLYPIAGTPLEGRKVLSPEEMCRIVAVYRFILPKAFIRLAGGRGLLVDQGKRCFQSGANAAISGDMLTTEGITVESDLRLLQELGYKVGDRNG